MRCHFVNDPEAGKVLIPGCWSVVHSNDIEDCTCNTNKYKHVNKCKVIELTIEEIRIVLNLIRKEESMNGYIAPEILALKERIRFEFGI